MAPGNCALRHRTLAPGRWARMRPSPGERVARSTAAPRLLLEAVDDAATVEVVRRDLDADAVARQDADAEPTHLAGEMREHDMTVLELDAEVQVLEGLYDLALQFDLLFNSHLHLVVS